MAGSAHSRGHDYALGASTVLPTLAFMVLGVVTVLAVALLGLSPADIRAPRAGTPAVVQRVAWSAVTTLGLALTLGVIALLG